MVRNNNPISRNAKGEPPPPDESWWEAILAEEETKSPSSISRNASTTTEAEMDFEFPGSNLSKEIINWDKARDLYREDKTIQIQVEGYNRGGLLVEGEGLHGFIPVSHLIDMPINLGMDEQEQCLEAYVQRSLTVKVIECDQQRGRVVFSERAALAESGKRNALLEQLTPGECVQGKVTNVTDFGIFVDLGGVEGLVHVSEISWGRVRHPADVGNIGNVVQVYVISVDVPRSRIALSLKRMCKNPWETAEEHYHPGQITQATITSLVPFGAFAQLEEGLDGLIHISEMISVNGSGHLSYNLCEGQRVQVRVLHVDAVKQRLGLSLQLNPSKGDE